MYKLYIGYRGLSDVKTTYKPSQYSRMTLLPLLYTQIMFVYSLVEMKLDFWGLSLRY